MHPVYFGLKTCFQSSTLHPMEVSDAPFCVSGNGKLGMAKESEGGKAEGG